MNQFSRRTFVASSLALTACSSSAHSADVTPEIFICPPCGCAEDNTEFQQPGRCPDCDMTLMPKHEHDLGFEPRTLAPRAGSFQVAGGAQKEDRRINVHYYLPDGLSRGARVLLIVPGAGRNSFEYRNAWLDVARRENILIAALGYAEESYDFAAYHMGGVIKNLAFQNAGAETPGVIRINDDDIKFDVNPNKEEWIYNDFDRIFDFLKMATGSTAVHYDIFGHSAGGQILHRFALFHPMSQARKIIAANAGWYTLPHPNVAMPFGLLNSPVTDRSLPHSFELDLTILLGENDNSDRAGGTLLHTPTVDAQGLNRLARGRNFHKSGQEQAARVGADLRWKIRTVPNVGHDHRGMGEAAAQIIVG